MRRASLPAVLLLSLATAVSCGSDDSSADDADGEVACPGAEIDVELVPGESTTTTVLGADKPEVDPPAEAPTELVSTELETGSGAEAAVGDTVFVDYVGVRQADGAEFDNSYEKGRALEVKLGQGAVIAGWDDGLVGSQQGDRLQLDIPAELAYGENPPAGSPIEAGDALTFVIDVRAVVPAGLTAPDISTIDASDGATETTFTDLEVGTGPVLESGMTAIIHMLLIRGDNKVVLDDTWAKAAPAQVPIGLDVGIPPGFTLGLDGMQVGGLRAIAMPPACAFGPTGYTQLGLPANTDLILVAQLFGAY